MSFETHNRNYRQIENAETDDDRSLSVLIKNAWYSADQGLQIERLQKEQRGLSGKRFGMAVLGLSATLHASEALGVNAIQDQTHQPVKAELVEKIGYDLQALCEKVGCTLQVDVESTSSIYVLHIGQAHHLSNRKMDAEDTALVTTVQEKIYCLLMLMAKENKQPAGFEVFSEGYAIDGASLFTIAKNVAQWVKGYKNPIVGMVDNRVKVLEKALNTAEMNATLSAYLDFAVATHFERLGMSYSEYKQALSAVNGKEISREQVVKNILVQGANVKLLMEGFAGIDINPAESAKNNSEVVRMGQELEKLKWNFVGAFVTYYDKAYPNQPSAKSQEMVTEYAKLLSLESDEQITSNIRDPFLAGALREYRNAQRVYEQAVTDREVKAIEMIDNRQRQKEIGFQRGSVYPLVYGGYHDFTEAVQLYNQKADTSYGLISIKFNDQPIDKEIHTLYFPKK